eukprot:TRINITY_DN7457_c0_g1_i3.p1 TRINITY_DN7457_c0_g1~~TRINITY_DN7457_c0_g1_i3.p1  ORF type:complete len:259 (+),score=51.76 TRINITY_DN7457_c0_g1_i3:82-777(+)
MQAENIALKQQMAQQSVLLEQMMAQLEPHQRKVSPSSRTRKKMTRKARPTLDLASALFDAGHGQDMEPPKTRQTSPSAESTSASSAPPTPSDLGLPSPLPSPHGLTILPPPGLPPPPSCTPRPGLAKADRESASRKAAAAGLWISAVDGEGTLSATVQWNIANVQAKLRSSCGAALVSQPFDVAGFHDLRLMFSPGEMWMNKRKKPGSASGEGGARALAAARCSAAEVYRQ